MRVFFGGMFDPVHLGHLRAAVEVRSLLQVPSVALVPASRPVHRPPPVASAELRLRLLELACAEGGGLVCDPREIVRGGESATVTTLRELRHEFGPAESLVWVVGYDAFLGLPRWREAETLAALAHFLVLARGPRLRVPATLRDWLVGTGFRRVHTPERLALRPAGLLYFFRPTPFGISSSQIRRLAREGGDLHHLVPSRVRQLLEETSCYGHLP